MTDSRGQMLAEHLRHKAWLRGEKADEYDDNRNTRRNTRSGRRLLDVAEYAERLADDDRRLVRMDNACYFLDGVCDPGEHGSELIRVWNFHSRTGSPEQFVNELAIAADTDAAELDELSDGDVSDDDDELD
jgi:hypothetical protein